MRRDGKVFLTMILSLVMVCIIGCGVSMGVNAKSGSDNNIIAEIHPSTQATEKENVQVNHKQWWEDEWKTEIITNDAGKEFELRYLASIVWPESEEETLAKYLSCEGGNYEEKSRIAQLVAWRRNDPEYPDTIQNVLMTQSYATIYPSFWNEIAMPTEEDYKIAKEALNYTEKPEYVYYVYKEFLEDFNIEPKEDVYMAENFVFFN